MLGGIQDVYLGTFEVPIGGGESSPIRRVLGGTGADSASVRRSVCRFGGSSAIAVAGTPHGSDAGRSTPTRQAKASPRVQSADTGRTRAVGPSSSRAAHAPGSALRRSRSRIRRGQPRPLTHRASSIQT